LSPYLARRALTLSYLFLLRAFVFSVFSSSFFFCQCASSFVTSMAAFGLRNFLCKFRFEAGGLAQTPYYLAPFGLPLKKLRLEGKAHPKLFYPVLAVLMCFALRKKYAGGYKSGILGKILGKIQVLFVVQKNSPSLPLKTHYTMASLSCAISGIWMCGASPGWKWRWN
jgi:hypothetical protein